MKKLAMACICAVFPLTNAQANTCLEHLQGDYFYLLNNVPDHVLTVQSIDNAWQFKRPTDPSADKEKLFKYSFNESNMLPAKPMLDSQLSPFGSALFSPYIDTPKQLEGVRYVCGLITDTFYIVYIDLSKANLELIKNMIMMDRAHAGKDYNAEPTAIEIDEMRKQTYFTGQPFELQGVTSGVLSFRLKKQ